MRMSWKVIVRVVGLAVISTAAAGLVACAPVSLGGEGGEASDGDVGSVGLALQAAPGVTIDLAAYSITGPGGVTRSGAIDVAHSATISALISGLPAGAGYAVSITAQSTDGSISCGGSATFSVVAHGTASVIVHLTCHEAPRTGSVSVIGTVNVCPVLDGISASPLEVAVGGSVALQATTHDSDAGPAALSFHWIASSGALAGTDTSSPTFTCGRPGLATVAVTVSDGDPTAGCAASGSLSITCRVPGAGDPATPFTMAVYGDVPYGTTPTDTAQFQAFPGLVASVNADPDVALVMHIGDIHSGKQYCTEAYDRSIYQLWTAYQDPVIYTPGDNEWTDCHKPAEGGGTYNATTGQIDFVHDASGALIDYAGGDPIANLALVRSIFFPTAGQSLGATRRQVVSQAQAFDPTHPSDAAFVENVMWEQSKVLFVTINLPGGSNNDTDVWYGAPVATAAQTQEVTDRTGADLRWLDAAFAQAQADGAVAVVIGAQADVWDPEKGAAHQAGYEWFVQSIASHTTAFGKPVIMFNGDSHVYLSHNPLSPADPLAALHPGYDVPNFHRVVVHGSTFPLEWLRLTIDPAASAPNGPDAFGPFSWSRVILP
jgi:hypothetical protein